MGISASGDLVDFEGDAMLDAPDENGEVGVTSSPHGFYVSLDDLREFVARHSESPSNPMSKKKTFFGEAVVRSRAMVAIRAKRKFGARARFDQGDFKIVGGSRMLDWELVGAITEQKG